MVLVQALYMWRTPLGLMFETKVQCMKLVAILKRKFAGAESWGEEVW